MSGALEQEVSNALEQRIGLRAGALMLVSVSGGADSVALLRLLLAVRERWRLRLHVLHFNHGLREESAEEEREVGHMPHVPLRDGAVHDLRRLRVDAPGVASAQE